MRTRFSFFLCAWLTAAFVARFSLGAINPEEFKKRATEVVELKVEKVETGMRRGQPILVLIRARITAVRRSAAGLGVGDSILIRYELDPEDIARRRAEHDRVMQGRVGGQFLHEPDAPRAGETVIAHLIVGEKSKDDKEAVRAFEPAAHQYSFENPR